MKKNCFLVCTILLLITWSALHGQVLLSVGNNKTTKDEFLQAFLKNNKQKPSEQAFKEYLELYIRFKLKVSAAYDAGLDTLATQKAELSDFRNQVTREYLHDEAIFDKLVKEAFERSRKDVHLAHIFVEFSGVDTEGNGQDTVRAWKQAIKAYNDLQKGAAFGEVTASYSSDKSAIINKGDIGYITVFTLPYNLEIVAYSTAPGKYSKPFKSKSGYHIFKNLGERRAAGMMRLAQILFAFPPDTDNATKSRIHHQADSVYDALLRGESFSQMVSLFSKDNISYTTKGELPEFGVGTYDALFENAVFSLQADGAISKPFLSAFGYHIIKRLAHIPVNTNLDNDSAMAALKQRVRDDPRMEVSRRSKLLQIYRLTRFEKLLIHEAALWTFTDSVVQNKKLPVLGSISYKTGLFSFPKRNVYVADWIKYIQDEKSSEYTSRTFPALYKQYQESITTGYYLDHLEELNPDFAAQMNEFKEGNLLFEIMQRNIWDKAASDSSMLKQYYESNQPKYIWEPGAAAIVFTCTDSAIAYELKLKLEKNNADWRALVSSYPDKVQADSGKFERSQLPVRPHEALSPGMITTPLQNPAPPGNISFAHIVKLYPEKTLRDFDEAKGFVLNDYQVYLEENWIAALKRTYPVQINNAVLQSLWKEKMLK